ncbi:MAG TPA: NADH-quinone oxidoreductase subunit K [Burkholderiaceae bacterium]|nr:NADH-quinone oxidoreductase subunit K [Burkholderiaceae bacterium]HQR74878.1 NADH-quinone oxidoreductase subunit K [Burkholderiaceae bacterium]
MNSVTWYGLVGATLAGIGLYGLIVHPHVLRKILSFNLLGSGVFLIAGVVARRGAEAGLPGDPVLQGLVITGIIVAFSATALAVALLLRLAETAHTASLSPGALAGETADAQAPADRSDPGDARQAEGA